MPDRFVRASEARQRESEIIMHLGIVWFDLYRREVMLQRFAIFAFTHESCAQINMRHKIPGRRCQSVFEESYAVLPIVKLTMGRDRACGEGKRRASHRVRLVPR